MLSVVAAIDDALSSRGQVAARWYGLRVSLQQPSGVARGCHLQRGQRAVLAVRDMQTRATPGASYIPALQSDR